MKRIISICLAAMLTLCLAPVSFGASGAETSNLTVAVKYNDVALSGINVSVCRVADMRESGSTFAFTATQAFFASGAEFKNLTTDKYIALATNLNAYAYANDIPRDAKTTDGSGNAVFDGLSDGLYLVAQEPGGNSGYAMAPYLILVPNPNEDGGGWNRDVVSYPKVKYVRNTDTVSVSVYKIWKGTNAPPASVSMQLYRNGTAYGDPMPLTEDNYWSYTWDGLDAAGTWTVDEVNVPAGYTKSVEGTVGNGFVITNTKDTPPAPAPTATTAVPGRPTQTGINNNMLLWISLAVCAGLSLAVATRVKIKSKLD